jgi:hypothetical protein
MNVSTRTIPEAPQALSGTQGPRGRRAPRWIPDRRVRAVREVADNLDIWRP